MPTLKNELLPHQEKAVRKFLRRRRQIQDVYLWSDGIYRVCPPTKNFKFSYMHYFGAKVMVDKNPVVAILTA